MKKLVLFLALVATLVMLASCENYESKITPLDGTSLSTYSAMVDNVELMGLQTADGKHITEPLYCSNKVFHGTVEMTYPGTGSCLYAVFDAFGKEIFPGKKLYVTGVNNPDSLSYLRLGTDDGDYLYFPDMKNKPLIGPMRGRETSVDSCGIYYRYGEKLYGFVNFSNIDILEAPADHVYTYKVGDRGFVIAEHGKRGQQSYKKYELETGKFIGTTLNSNDRALLAKAEANRRASNLMISKTPTPESK